MSDIPQTVRERTIIDFSLAESTVRNGTEHWFARGQNFAVEWIDGKAAGAEFEVSTAEEAFLLLPETGATLSGAAGSVKAPRRSVCILPPGSFKVTVDAPGACACLYSDPAKLAQPGTINAAAYTPPDPRVAPVGMPYRRVNGGDTISVFEVDKITTKGPNPAMKVLQSATMSMSWVDREGARDRTTLSPHVHQDFEQGSLAIHGSFIHHLRVEWGKNAELWRDDEHSEVPPKSLLVIPPGLIHTTEGIGEGAHLLIDVFAPARRDFIEKGFVANSDDYVAS